LATDFVLDDEQRIQKENAIIFLTEYAKDTNRTYNIVAKKLGIPQSTAKNYLKRFIAAYHRGKQHGGEEWQRIVLALYNKDLADIGYPKEKLLKAHVITQMIPIIERYDDFNILENESEKNITNNNNMQNNNSVSYNLDPFTDEAGTDVNYDEDLYLADKLRSFTDSSNVTLLREVLRRIPTVPKNQIGNFIEMFKLNEDVYMRSPEAFKEFVRGFFGKSEYIAKMITDAFVNSVTKYGNSQAGFGVNPFTGMASNQPSYYDYPGMVPMANSNLSDPRSMMLFEEMMYRRKQREEDEKLDREMQRHIRMSTMNMLNGISQNRQGGNGNDMMQYVLAGMLKPVMRIDEQGKQIIEYVPNMGFGQNPSSQQGGTNDLTTILIGKMLDMNTAMITKSAEQPKYFETLLSTLLSKQIDRNPIEDVKNLISLKEQIAPAVTGAPSQEQLNYQLKKEELNFHKDLELHKLEMEAKKLDHERAMQIKEAEKADTNTKEIMGGLSGLFKDIAQPLIGQFLGGNKGGMTQEQLAALLQAQRANSVNQQQGHEEFDTRGGYTPDYINPNSSNNLSAYLEKIRLDQNQANAQQIEMLKQQAALNQQEIIKMRENTAKQIVENVPKPYSEKDYSNLNDEQLSNVINNIDNMEKMLQKSRENAKKLLESRNGAGVIKNAFDYEREKEDNDITIPSSNLDPDDVGVEVVNTENQVTENGNFDFSQINQVEQEKQEININPDNISVTIN